MEVVCSPPWRERALMYRKVGSFLVLVLVLALCTAGAAFALPLDPEMAAAPSGTGLLDGVWNRFLGWIDSLVGGEGGLTALWLDGCHIDPNGGHCVFQ
jgi:hypothetical protein